MDTEKLKTLALAYLDANRGYWYGAHELADGTTYEPGVDFIVECNPATVLALIADVERLRNERDTKITEHVKDLHKLICVQAERDELRAEVERLRADAERYVFIRSGGIYIEPGDGEIYVATDSGAYCKTDEEFDSQIDAAIKKEKA